MKARLPSRRVSIALGGLAAAAALLYVARRLAGAERLPELLADLTDSLGAWTYGLVGLMSLLETGAFVGLVAPGETVVVVGGLAAQHGAVSLPVIAAIAWAAAFTGDSVSFALGRRYGNGLLERAAKRFRIPAERLTKMESFFLSHGGKSLLLGRFIGFVRALAPFMAGSSGLSYRSFFPWSLVGTGIWAITFSVVGYAFAASFEAAAGIVTGAVVALAAVVVAVWLVRERRSHQMLPAPGV